MLGQTTRSPSRRMTASLPSRFCSTAEHPPPVTGSLNATLEPATLVAAGMVVSLDSEADGVRLSVADRIALHAADLRRWMARRVMWTVVGANLVTLAALAGLVALDQSNIESHLISPGDRIIGHQVILALLGATTVQVGT